MEPLVDSYGRTHTYLRLSVTDRCNLRCVYCMPEAGVSLMSHYDILSYEEIYTVVKAAAELGIDRVRLTGGEPLVRAGLTDLISLLAGIETIEDLSLTTNGILLAQHAAELKEAGLQRVNISLDTLKPERFRQITRCGSLKDTLEGIEAARTAGLKPVKINMVVMAGLNDDELTDFAAKTVKNGWNVRFIELMPSSGNEPVSDKLVSVSEMRQRLEPMGELTPCLPSVGNGPAKYFRLPQAKGAIGFITPISEHFCFHCNRLRLTADGKLRPCLLSQDEIDLRAALRSGAATDEIKKLIEMAVAAKPVGHSMTPSQAGLNRPFSQIGG